MTPEQVKDTFCEIKIIFDQFLANWKSSLNGNDNRSVDTILIKGTVYKDEEDQVFRLLKDCCFDFVGIKKGWDIFCAFMKLIIL